MLNETEQYRDTTDGLLPQSVQTGQVSMGCLPRSRDISDLLFIRSLGRGK